MKSIYHIRDWKGPHDVPAAEILEAKFCITSFSQVYSFYLMLLEKLNYKLNGISDTINEFINSIILLSPMVVTGRKGKPPLIDEVILNLYQNGFFANKKSFKEIGSKIEERYNFPKPTILNSLNRFYFKKKILNRGGKRGEYKFAQRLPPEEFYK